MLHYTKDITSSFFFLINVENFLMLDGATTTSNQQVGIDFM
jgi:hypothetical protein